MRASPKLQYNVFYILIHALCPEFQEDELNDAVLVVLANKQDMEGCMSVAEVHQALGLEALKNRTFQVSLHPLINPYLS